MNCILAVFGQGPEPPPPNFLPPNILIIRNDGVRGKLLQISVRDLTHSLIEIPTMRQT